MGDTAVVMDAAVLENGPNGSIVKGMMKPAAGIDTPLKSFQHSGPKVVSFKMAGIENLDPEEDDEDEIPSPATRDSSEPLEVQPDSLDEDEDDFVVYDEGVEQAELTGRLSELSRRTTQESVEGSFERIGSERLGKIELLLAEHMEEIESDSESSLLGDKDVSNELAALQAEVEREVINVGRRSISRHLSGAVAHENRDVTKLRTPPGEAQNSSLSGGSPITLRNSVYGEIQHGVFSDVPLLIGSQGSRFEGLVYCETVDSLGRPVVVINTSAIPSKQLRNKAFEHIYQSLHSVVENGPYVLVFASFSSDSLSKVSASWVIAAYRKLTKSFRKNVEYVVLVRPNRWLRGIVKLLSMVVKKKSKRKLKQIQFLSEIGNVTSGEVQLEHLSSRVLASIDSN